MGCGILSLKEGDRDMERCEDCGRVLSNIELAEIDLSEGKILCDECKELDSELKSVEKG